MNIPLNPVDIAPFRVDGVMVQPHDAPDLVQQLRALILTFHAESLDFGCDCVDIPIGLFDLNLCPISCYQVKLTCQSMVMRWRGREYG